MNIDKTELFCAGISNNQMSEMVKYGFNIAKLPIRYLGLPLLHRRLKVSDYDALFLAVEKAFTGWASKSLSYAGRLQLISSVIYGIINFWLSVFPLPQRCIKRLESLCSRFLWSGGTSSHSKCKVSWKAICLPKEEGGLGLRRFSIWNKVLCLRYVWSLFSSKDSLWVSWHKKHSLNETSFWAVKPAARHSWNWNRLLKLRNLATRFVKGVLRDGQVLSFWYDDWTALGPLINFIGVDGPTLLRVRANDVIASVTGSGNWNLPPPRTDNAVSLHAYLTTITPPTSQAGPDHYEWNVNEKNSNGYIASSTWNACRPNAEVKPWAKHVWFKGHIPKQAFHMWMSNLNRLPTRKRLATWGMNVNNLCPFCNFDLETRDHILLSCGYSQKIWKLAVTRVAESDANLFDWESLIAWIMKSNQASPSILRKMISQSILYNIWKQRNNLIHNRQYVPPQVIFKMIYREVMNLIWARSANEKHGSLRLLWIM